MTPQPPTDDAPFTTGEFIHLAGDRGIYTRLNDGCRGLPICHTNSITPTDNANAKLMLAAFQAGTSLHRAGYDAQKVFEALPKLLESMEAAEHYFGDLPDSLTPRLRRKQKP